MFEEAICAALGQKKFGGQDFVSQCLELFDDEDDSCWITNGSDQVNS